MKKAKKTILAIFIILVAGVFYLPQKVNAYTIEQLSNVKVEGDFTVGPGKSEVFLTPGEEVTKEIFITNRTGRTINFKITLEDFKGTRTGESALILLGAEKGPYSLMDYLKPEITEFALEHGQRIGLPVEISIPQDAEPGGLYGAAIISALPPAAAGESKVGEARGQLNITARIGALFFVRVKGEVKEDGFLRVLRMADGRKIYDRGPFSFELLFENNGSVHLDPYGIIEIKNVLGKKIGEIELEPWFVMPDSLRSRVIQFDKKWLFGRYTAVARVNRGYGDIIDEKSVTFWVLPWQIILPTILGIILIVLLFYWFFSKFEIRTKKTV